MSNYFSLWAVSTSQMFIPILTDKIVTKILNINYIENILHNYVGLWSRTQLRDQDTA